MKKFLLFILLAFTAQFGIAQTNSLCIASSQIKRNNGNSCKTITNPTGGKVTIDFGVLPAANFQLYDVIAGPTSSTVVPSTKEIKTQNASISWCFEVDNMGSFSTANYTFRYYYDQAPFNIYNGEPVFQNCSGGLIDASGAIFCGTGTSVQELNFTVYINSKYDDLSTAGTDYISGTYEVYADVNGNNSVDGADMKVKNSTSFTTSSPAISGYTSRFTQFNVPFDVPFPGFGITRYNALVSVKVTSVGTVALTQTLDTTGILPNNCGALPVSFVSFNAVQRSGKAALSWATATESNNDGFEVERRIGNGQYQKIGFVDSKAPTGTGAAYTYNFEDPTPLTAGVTYYRLKQIDFDGSASYSEVKAVRTANGALVLSVYPNPSRGNATLVIPDGTGNVNVSVEDFAGRAVLHFNNISARNVQLTNLKAGLYAVRVFVVATGETKTERLTVQ